MKPRIREDVCLILNEAETRKAQTAIDLSEALHKQRVCARRKQVSPTLIEELIALPPRVIVSDYLLGNIGTVIDLLQSFKRKNLLRETQILVWTDEPSVSAAVSAMKFGASDYIEMSQQPDVESVATNIVALLDQALPDNGSQPQKTFDFIAEDSAMKSIYRRISYLASRDESQIIVLLGPRGAGRNYCAKLFHHNRLFAGSLVERDISVWLEESELLWEDPAPLLSYAATVFFDHIDRDDGTLFEHSDLILEQLRAVDTPKPRLLLGTTLEPVAAAWQNKAQATIIKIPSLKERGTDFSALFLYFTESVRRSTGQHSPRLSAEAIAWLAHLEWPGNVRQLIAAVWEATAQWELVQTHLWESDSGALAHAGSDTKANKLLYALGGSEKQFLSCILEAKNQWERFESCPAPCQITRWDAFRILRQVEGNVSIAAASVGLSRKQFINLLRADETELLGHALPLISSSGEGI